MFGEFGAFGIVGFWDFRALGFQRGGGARRGSLKGTLLRNPYKESEGRLGLAVFGSFWWFLDVRVLGFWGL